MLLHGYGHAVMFNYSEFSKAKNVDEIQQGVIFLGFFNRGHFIRGQVISSAEGYTGLTE